MTTKEIVAHHLRKFFTLTPASDVDRVAEEVTGAIDHSFMLMRRTPNPVTDEQVEDLASDHDIEQHQRLEQMVAFVKDEGILAMLERLREAAELVGYDRLGGSGSILEDARAKIRTQNAQIAHWENRVRELEKFVSDRDALISDIQTKRHQAQASFSSSLDSIKVWRARAYRLLYVLHHLGITRHADQLRQEADNEELWETLMQQPADLVVRQTRDHVEKRERECEQRIKRIVQQFRDLADAFGDEVSELTPENATSYTPNTKFSEEHEWDPRLGPPPKRSDFANAHEHGMAYAAWGDERERLADERLAEEPKPEDFPDPFDF